MMINRRKGTIILTYIDPNTKNEKRSFPFNQDASYYKNGVEYKFNRLFSETKEIEFIHRSNLNDEIINDCAIYIPFHVVNDGYFDKIVNKEESKMEIMNIEQAKAKYIENLTKIKVEKIKELTEAINKWINEAIEGGCIMYVLNINDSFSYPSVLKKPIFDEVTDKFRQLGYTVVFDKELIMFSGWAWTEDK